MNTNLSKKELLEISAKLKEIRVLLSEHEKYIESLNHQSGEKLFKHFEKENGLEYCHDEIHAAFKAGYWAGCFNKKYEGK